MTLLASVLVGVFTYIAAGYITGNPPRLGSASRFEGAPRFDGPGKSQLWLIQAGAELTPAQFVGGSIAVAAAAFAVVFLLTGTSVVAIVPAVTVGFVPKIYFTRRRAVRMRELEGAWPDGIRHILGGISSGFSLHQAICDLASSGPRPLRRAFERFEITARMVGTSAALEVVKEELAMPTSDRVIEVLVLAQERGGRIVTEVLDDLARTTAEDIRALAEIETDRLEQKINSRAVFALPWFVLVLLTAAPGPFRDFYRSPRGLFVVFLGSAMSLAGMWIVARLARDPSEQRIFAASDRKSWSL